MWWWLCQSSLEEVGRPSLCVYSGGGDGGEGGVWGGEGGWWGVVVGGGSGG